MTRRAYRAWLPLALALHAAGCASGGPGRITAADLPRLEAEAAASPGDGVVVLRLAAAQQAAGDCAAAIETARRGMQLRPQDPLGPLVAGECLERGGEPAEAVALYDAYTAEYANVLGASAVEARAMLARRDLAAADARALVANEANLGQEGGDPNVLAVMPLEIVGDEAYEPLSFGLASMITSDLALVERIRLVERAQLDALLREIRLGEMGALDPATAARAGRMLRAGTIAHGLSHISPDERLRLEVSLMDTETRIAGTASVNGRFADLFRLEKDLVLALIDELGVQLTQVERNAILENGTRSLAAFLAYSRGLLEQDAGNYAAAAQEFSRAVREDPGFQAAREGHAVTSSAATVQSAGPGAAATLASTSVSSPGTPTAVESAASALSTGVQDVSPTLGEALGSSAGAPQAAVTATASAPPSTTGAISQVILFSLRLVLRFP